MTEIKVNVDRGTYLTIHAKDIVVKDRCRGSFQNITELSESILRFGLDNPLTVGKRPDGKYELIAGERRYRALLILGVQQIPVIDRPDMDEAVRKEFELEENLQRADLTWGERIEGERQLDAIKRAMHPGDWGLKDTAEALKTSLTTVSRDISFAQKLKDRPELRKAIGDLPLHAAIKRVERIEAAEKVSKEGVGVDGVLRKGDARELLKGVASGSIALVLTDPPFGIDALESNRGGGNVQTTGLMKESDNLTSTKVEEMYQWLLPEISRVLMEGGHFYVFCCQQLWGSLRSEALKVGLEIQEYPVIWWKGRTTAPGRGYVYTPCTEPIFFGWKPPRKRMLDKNMAALVECRPAGSKGAIHTFQKPVELLRTFITQSTIPGEIVLDPFCGSASTVVAAIETGRVGIGFDLDPEGTTFTLASKRVSEALRVSSQVGKSGV